MAKLADSSIAVNSTEANTGRCSAEKDADAAVAKAYFDAHPATTTEEPTTEEPVETGDGLVFVVIALVISASCAVVFSKKRAR
ncbi:hypothetical protein SDC9_153732 [bioreactor metagenome]|uniref:Uncharacterized protein n=1 Tax=bioreactor metagenome TaxID=1076179 RepID=A0A645EYH4_9ZZZZ